MMLHRLSSITLLYLFFAGISRNTQDLVIITLFCHNHSFRLIFGKISAPLRVSLIIVFYFLKFSIHNVLSLVCWLSGRFAFSPALRFTLTLLCLTLGIHTFSHFSRRLRQ